MAGVASEVERETAGYAPHEHRPLGAYAGLTAAFAAAFAGSLAGLRASGRELPERPSAADIALAGVATHKLTRLLAKDRVTSFLRAPFARYQEPAGHAVSFAAAPRTARFIGGMYAAQTLSDFLQLAYKTAEDRA